MSIILYIIGYLISSAALITIGRVFHEYEWNKDKIDVIGVSCVVSFLWPVLLIALLVGGLIYCLHRLLLSPIKNIKNIVDTYKKIQGEVK